MLLLFSAQACCGVCLVLQGLCIFIAEIREKLSGATAFTFDSLDMSRCTSWFYVCGRAQSELQVCVLLSLHETTACSFSVDSVSSYYDKTRINETPDPQTATSASLVPSSLKRLIKSVALYLHS